jgi:hypothetical protein
MVPIAQCHLLGEISATPQGAVAESYKAFLRHNIYWYWYWYFGLMVLVLVF